MTKHPALPEPVIVSDFWRNRRGEAVRIQLREFNGQVLADVRVHYTNAEGRLAPTAKGLSITIAKLPELAAGIGKALAKAKQLGLVDDEAGHG